MSENVKRWVEVGAIVLGCIVAVLSAYHSLDGRVTATEGRAAVVDARVMAAESRIEQETKGYLILQSELAKRLDRLEGKLDVVIEQRRGR